MSCFAVDAGRAGAACCAGSEERFFQAMAFAAPSLRVIQLLFSPKLCAELSRDIHNLSDSKINAVPVRTLISQTCMAFVDCENALRHLLDAMPGLPVDPLSL